MLFAEDVELGDTQKTGSGKTSNSTENILTTVLFVLRVRFELR